MGPSHAAKGGRHWRYYVSRTILTGRKPDAGSVTRVPAAQIEKQVFDAIKGVVASGRATEGIGALSPLASGRAISSSRKLYEDSISQFGKRNFAARDWRAYQPLRRRKQKKFRAQTALGLAKSLK
jgi:hypothetical protein